MSAHSEVPDGNQSELPPGTLEAYRKLEREIVGAYAALHALILDLEATVQQELAKPNSNDRFITLVQNTVIPRLQQAIKEIDPPREQEKVATFSFDPDSETYPVELHIAVRAWEAVSANPSPTKSPRQQILDFIQARHRDLSTEAKNRIATMANWNQKGGKPKSE